VFSRGSNKLSELVPGSWSNITRTLFFAQNYGGRADFERAENSLSSIDLLDWLARMKKTVNNLPENEIALLEAAALKLMIATEKGPKAPFCNGLSFYAPLREANQRSDYANTDFNKKTGWLEVLVKLHEMQAKEGMESPKVVSIEIGTPAASEIKKKLLEGKPVSGTDFEITPKDFVIPMSGKDENGSWVKIVLEGVNTLWGYSGVAMSDTRDPNGDYTICLISFLMDENLDLGATENKEIEAANLSDALTPIFKDGANELAYMIGGLTHRFSNGEKSVLVMGEYVNASDMKHFTVEGMYSDQQTGEVEVTISVNTDYYLIDSVMAVSEKGMAYTVSPKPEGVFCPVLKKSDSNGLIKKERGEEILWKNGLFIILEPIPEGKYMKIAVMAESIGGTGGQLLSQPISMKANPIIAANIDATHREGLNKLLGDYAVIAPIQKANSDEMVFAPTGNVIDIKTESNPNGGTDLIAVMSIMGEMEIKTDLILQMEGLPYIGRYIQDENGKYQLLDRNFMLLVQDGNSYLWKMCDSSNLESLSLIPLKTLRYLRNT
jgi:hypothetical protein